MLVKLSSRPEPHALDNPCTESGDGDRPRASARPTSSMSETSPLGLASKCMPPACSSIRSRSANTEVSAADQCAAPLGIETSHPLQMSGEVALRHEPGDNGLFQPAAAGAEKRHRRGETVDQAVGNDEVTQPQPRKQHLAEAAGIEHDVAAIEVLQCRQRPTGIVEFAVVVVFEDPCRIRLGPGD